MGGQGGCERRIEFFVKISKKKIGGGGGSGGGEGSGLGGQGGCEWRIEVFGKIHKKKLGGGRGREGGSGGGSGWWGVGVRVDVNEELKFLGGVGLVGGGGQGGCERRIEVFGKIHTKKNWGEGGSGGGLRLGWSGWM